VIVFAQQGVDFRLAGTARHTDRLDVVDLFEAGRFLATSHHYSAHPRVLRYAHAPAFSSATGVRPGH